MARVLYNEIYRSLRERIAEGKHPVGSFLPSEQNLVKEFSCSRMTVRKAISLLANEGLVQSIKGRGVLVLESSAPGAGKEAAFTVSGLSSFSESAHAIGAVPTSRIVYLEHVSADERLALLTGFPEGEDLTHLKLVRMLDAKPVAVDRHYFLTSSVPGLNEKNATSSLFHYIEDELGLTIAVSKRTATLAQPDVEDCRLLGIDSSSYLAVLTSQTFDSTGTQFEYVEARYIPSIFHFHDTATRTPLP